MNFDVILKDLDGEPIQVAKKIQEIGLCRECAEKIAGAMKVISLRDTCTEALLNGDVRNLDGKQRWERALLAQKVHSESPTLTSEEVTLVKEAIGQMYGPLVIMRAWSMLDPALSESKD